MQAGLEHGQQMGQFPKKIMVWGGISMMGCTPITFVRGTMDGAAYRAVLQRALVPAAAGFPPGWAFQQDGARPHTCKATMAWLRAHPTLPEPIKWPPYSADVSPIENMWSALQDDVNQANPATLPELERAIRQAWAARIKDKAYMGKLLGGWRRRIQQLRDGGGATLPH